MPPSDSTSPTLEASGPEALAQARAAAASLADDELVPIRVDVTAAAFGVLGSLPEVAAHRAEIVAVFGARGADAIDAVEPAARAAAHADAAYRIASEPNLEPAAAALAEKKALFLTLARTLVARGLVDPRSLDGLEGGQAYLALSTDAIAIAAWFRENAAVTGQFAKVTDAELDELEADGERFGRAVAERDRARAGSAPKAKDRARAFTHLDRVWDRVRKYVTFVRWHQADYDRIAPTFYAGRGGGGERVRPAAPSATPPPGMPGAPALSEEI